MFVWVEKFSYVMPTVFAVLGIIWLAALALWIGEKIVAFVKRQPNAEVTLTLPDPN